MDLGLKTVHGFNLNVLSHTPNLLETLIFDCFMVCNKYIICVGPGERMLNCCQEQIILHLKSNYISISVAYEDEANGNERIVKGSAKHEK